MINSHISKTKVFFSASALLLAGVIIVGSFSLKNISVVSTKSFERTASYLKYKIAFSGGSNMLASVGGLFDATPETTIDGTTPAGLIPVFVYHGIVKENDRFSITQSGFAEHMYALKKQGFETVSMRDLYEFVYNGKVLPPRSFVLTFDDGRKDSYYGADPVLKALGYKATMFIATGVSLPETETKKSTYYLSKDEIIEMNDTGRWEIASHAIQAEGGFIQIDVAGTKGNFLSNKMWIKDSSRLETNSEYAKRVTNELTESKNRIQEVLSTQVLSMSYPFGDYGQQSDNINSNYAKEVIHEAIRKNYKMAFVQIWPAEHEFSQNGVKDNPYFLKRIEPSPFWSGEELISHVASGQEKQLPYTETFSENSGWRNIWGEFTLIDGGFSAGAGSETAGSFAFLDGTLPWANYISAYELDWNKGSHVSLVSRYHDSENYVACVFSDDNVRIEQRVLGVQKKLIESKLAFTMPHEKVGLGMSVDGATAECYLGDTVVANATGIDSTLHTGGVAIKTWDEKVGTSAITVHSFRVVKYESGIKNFLQTVALTPRKEITKPTSTENPSIPKPTAIKYIDLVDERGTINPYHILDFTNSKGWKNFWGTYTIDGTMLSVGATPRTQGGLTVLMGSQQWKDYSVSVIPESLEGLSFSLIARYASTTDMSDYVACVFMNYGSRGYVRLDETKNGVTKPVVAQFKLSRFFPSNWKQVPFGMTVVGNEVRCIANGDAVVTATIPTMPAKGGIGIGTWSTTDGGSKVKIKELDVFPIL
jgi:peptidoglycan/xylan/chitin deacetylase (PgdA/CDA1 family)